MLQVKTDYTEYIVKVTVTSEDKAIDLTSPEFRIDIGDYLYSFLHRGEIRTYDDSVITEASTPLVTVTSENVATYCNTDEDSLIQNGFQFWVSEDNKKMEMRFIPKNIAPERQSHHWYALIVAVAFDFENTARFDLCLMPRIMPGEIIKKYPAETDKVLPTSAYRPDYIFSDENDKDHLFINQYKDRAEDGTALYAATFSAFMPEDLAAELGVDTSRPGDWPRKIAFCQPGANEGLALDGFDANTAEIDLPGCSAVNVVTITQDINPVDKVDYYKDHVMVEYEF
jgi:hypothetical protein